MKRNTGMPRSAWVALGILALGGGLFSLGQRETRAFPSAESVAPSGTAAFSRLLEQQGYSVVADRRRQPRLRPDDLAVAFVIVDTPFTLLGEGTDTPNDPLSPTFQHLHEHLSQGGRVLLLPVSYDFPAASRAAFDRGSVSVDSATGDEFQVVASTLIASEEATVRLAPDASSVPLFTSGEDAFVTGSLHENGVAVILSDGIIATNRFLDREDNAQVLESVVRALSSPDGRVVIAEASFGNVQEPGLLASIGRWAQAGWNQLLLLVALIVFTLGKRFGVAETERGRQRGARELLDALADTLLRAKADRLSMQLALTRADSEIRSFLKLARDAPNERRDEMLPRDLQMALALLQAALEDRDTQSRDAVRKVRRVEEEMDAFFGTRDRRRRRAKISI
jgi:hypothetical protein